MIEAPPPPLPRLCLGVTGHRANNAAFSANQPAVEAALAAMFARIGALVEAERQSLGVLAPVRLHSLLASGVDQLAANLAEQRGWEVTAPLPFGRALNLAINAFPSEAADARALLTGEMPGDSAVGQRAELIRKAYAGARLFELADRDEAMAALFLDHLDHPADRARAQVWNGECSVRVALAGRVMIEQSDLIIAVWDGGSNCLTGGTGHTIAASLDAATPVIWIDPARPDDWCVLQTVEDLLDSRPRQVSRDADLAALVHLALRPGEGGAFKRGAEALAREAWHPHSHRFWTLYRRIETFFGGEGRPLRSLTRRYETPDQISGGSGAATMAAARSMASADPEFADKIERGTLRRFAWSDGISARVSDFYRGGMMANFLLSALAVAAGLAYQPLHLEQAKVFFALAEFLLLSLILLIIWRGRRASWHKRWFETRRVAEYFRHAPMLQLLGVARPAGRWPKGSDTSWPEYYARHGLREAGLPRLAIDRAYLREGLTALRDHHVRSQRDYHVAKARRLHKVHHRLDRLSAWLFIAAFCLVAIWLAMKAAGMAGLVPLSWSAGSASLFTFFGVMCPTFGAAIAGMRYFGDFERFAAISHVAATKLNAFDQRMGQLLGAPDDLLGYSQVAEIARAVDAAVVEEIEGWQSVFGRKHIAVPV
ncbi:hypothetical protein [Novosphingobium aquae]|uniref:SMODS and SLOG-associating 2TM effector domain-containing protein n=1 Tax=Novosphingobium aquae TaxID=3133435 RepID=A0ABU8SEB5_9SPHN